MKNIAPDIVRQRLLIEGYYQIDVTPEVIENYFKTITKALALRMYGKPIIFSPGGEGKAENQGYDAFVPLIDSGVSVYIWSQKKFFSGIIYTCKAFDKKVAENTTRDFFKMSQIVKLDF